MSLNAAEISLRAHINLSSVNFVFLFYIFTIPAFDRTRNVNVFARAEMRFVHTHSRPFDQHNDDAFVHACAKALRSLRFFFFTLCSVCDFFSFYVAVVAATGSKSSSLLFNGPETNILLTIVFSLYDIHKTICVKDLFIRLVGLVSSLSLLCEPNADGYQRKQVRATDNVNSVASSILIPFEK